MAWSLFPGASVWRSLNVESFLSTRQRLRGPVVPLKIPYSTDEAIDYEALGRHVDWLCDQGVPVLLLTYGSGEFMCLTDAEIYDVTRAVGEVARGRTFFIAANNFWPVAKTVDYVRHAMRCGADAVKAHIHWKYKYMDEGVFAFYRKIAEAVPEAPLLAYTDFAPGISVAVVRRLADEIPQVIGMKNDSDPMVGYFNYTRKAGPDFEVMTGGTMGAMIYGYPYGARSYLCPIAPFQPSLALEFYGLVEQRRYDEAAQYVTQYEEPLMDLVPQCGYHWQVFIRALLFVAGCLPSPCPRLPFTPLPDERIAWLRKEFERIGFTRAGLCE